MGGFALRSCHAAPQRVSSCSRDSDGRGRASAPPRVREQARASESALAGRPPWRPAGGCEAGRGARLRDQGRELGRPWRPGKLRSVPVRSRRLCGAYLRRAEGLLYRHLLRRLLHSAGISWQPRLRSPEDPVLGPGQRRGRLLQLGGVPVRAAERMDAAGSRDVRLLSLLARGLLRQALQQRR